jgi:acyl carrier protein
LFDDLVVEDLEKEVEIVQTNGHAETNGVDSVDSVNGVNGVTDVTGVNGINGSNVNGVVDVPLTNGGA